MKFDWSTLNSLLLMAVLGYLWRQSRTVDQLKQSLLGLDGKDGALSELRTLRGRVHDLANVMTTLNITVGHLTAQLLELKLERERESKR